MIGMIGMLRKCAAMLYDFASGPYLMCMHTYLYLVLLGDFIDYWRNCNNNVVNITPTLKMT